MEAKGKKSSMMGVKKEVNGEEEWCDEEMNEGFDAMNGYSDDDESGYKKKRVLSDGKKGSSSGGVSNMKCCQADKCNVELSDCKAYHRRHKVCAFHAKAHSVVVSGITQRFCQQCSRFHELGEFDNTKRSCRRRLAGHNERRRKNTAESHPQGTGRKGLSADLNDMVCGQVDDRGRIKITIRDHTSYEHFRIR